MCFDNQINTTIYSKYSQTCLSELRSIRIPAIRNKWLGTDFSQHISPSNPETLLSETDSEIEERICHTNRKKTLNRITPTVTYLFIKSQWKGESQFSTNNECNSGRPCRTELLVSSTVFFAFKSHSECIVAYVYGSANKQKQL